MKCTIEGCTCVFDKKTQLWIPAPEVLIELACRLCYDSECNEEKRTDFLKSVIKRGHHSVVEHASVSFLITEVSRALTHQLVRHRIASYSQRSQRYVKESQFEYVIPPTIASDEESKVVYLQHMVQTQKVYDFLVTRNIPKEDARYVLPNACHTQIMLTLNFRSLRNLLKLRMDSHAQWEIRALAKSIFDIIYPMASAVFEDLKILREGS